jgi:hypothetical protein
MLITRALWRHQFSREEAFSEQGNPRRLPRMNYEHMRLSHPIAAAKALRSGTDKESKGPLTQCKSARLILQRVRRMFGIITAVFPRCGTESSIDGEIPLFGYAIQNLRVDY